VAQLRGPTDFFSTMERAQGFSKTVADADAVEVTVSSTARTPTPDEGARLMRLLLDRTRSVPTAVFAHHDLMALGALAALRERGLECPKHVSVIGFHALPQVDRVTPPLTTIRQPGEELGRIAADMTVAILNSPRQPPVSRSLAPTLVVRESTAPRQPGNLETKTVRKSKR
jgi:LacI family transcriptional regulator